MSPLPVQIITPFLAILVVAWAGRRWISPAPAGKHAGGASVRLTSHGRHREQRSGLSAHDAGTITMFESLRAVSVRAPGKVRAARLPGNWRQAVRTAFADDPEPMPAPVPDVMHAADTAEFLAVHEEALTATDRALGVRWLCRPAAEDLARTWEPDTVPLRLVPLVFPYADMDELNGAWLMFRDAILKADAIRWGTEHWSAYYAYEDLGNYPTEAAIGLSRREADDAYAALVGGPAWASPGIPEAAVSRG